MNPTTNLQSNTQCKARGLPSGKVPERLSLVRSQPCRVSVHGLLGRECPLLTGSTKRISSSVSKELGREHHYPSPPENDSVFKLSSQTYKDHARSTGKPIEFWESLRHSHDFQHDSISCIRISRALVWAVNMLYKDSVEMRLVSMCVCERRKREDGTRCLRA